MCKRQPAGQCLACGVALKQPLLGRKRVYCSKQCRDLQRQQRDRQKTSGIKGRKKKRVAWSCLACANTFNLRPFEAATKKFCSVACASGSRTSSKGRGPYSCKHCAKTYYTKRRKGEGESFCSRACSESYTPLRTGPHTRIELIECAQCSSQFASRRGVKLCSKRCRLDAGRDRAKQSEIVKHRRRKPIRCAHCACVFSRLYGNKSRVCSENCEQAAARALKRKEKSARRAAERSGRIAYGTLDPFDVFERDGWSCNQCGVPTPVGLRGTTQDNAPELDHVQPLSKGGVHSIENAQLLCRSCNIAKADKWDGRAAYKLLL